MVVVLVVALAVGTTATLEAVARAIFGRDALIAGTDNARGELAAIAAVSLIGVGAAAKAGELEDEAATLPNPNVLSVESAAASAALRGAAARISD